ncbi:hypothetical protein BD310DRAFT_164073 [Dichomitus squalens]|uniref:Uncharacterized protein n=1 Tax=Dichomitus squalens TaxID=114155 RepID=A0A4Q9PHJ1_9APHY|nr:hypothetical protein BD310DRAFT_164073 [Dichomitus squalens]
MRLLNTYTGEFRDFPNHSEIPLYAILSHTWDPNGEQSYQDVRRIQDTYKISAASRQISSPSPAATPPAVPLSSTQHQRSSHSQPSDAPFLGPDPGASISVTDHISAGELSDASRAADGQDTLPTIVSTPFYALSGIWEQRWGLSAKIRKACEMARNDGYDFIWIDSSCIDKTSSSELQEAINSMYPWYGSAHTCYAFLSDVPSSTHVKVKGSAFRESRWFKRGWTLQELIAPPWIVFLSSEWKVLGTKDGLVDVIHEITLISRRILRHEDSLDTASIAQRMSWAAGRQTTRVEDQAYSLQGLLGINMHTLYGEGEQAFRRLQEEILTRYPDQSILAWGTVANLPTASPNAHPVDCHLTRKLSNSLLALAPGPEFSTSNNIVPTNDTSLDAYRLPPLEYTHTPYGIRTRLRLVSFKALADSGARLVAIYPPNNTVDWYLAILDCSPTGHEEKRLGRVCYIRRADELANRPCLYSGEATFEVDGRLSKADLFAVSSSDLLDLDAHSETKTVYLPYLIRGTVGGVRGLLDPEAHTIRLTVPVQLRDALRDCGFTISNTLGPTERRPHSHFFTISGHSLNIYVEFVHLSFNQPRLSRVVNLLIGARVWLSCPGEDGRVLAPSRGAPPYAALTWRDYRSWPTKLASRNVVLDAGENISVQLGLVRREGSFYGPLQIDVAIMMGAICAPPQEPTLPTPSRSWKLSYGLMRPHQSISLTLLGVDRKALQSQDYSIRLDAPTSNNPDMHSLTMSTSNYSIVMNFFHFLHVPPGDEARSQSLLLAARVTLKSSGSGQGLPICEDGLGTCIVGWRDDYRGRSGKRWSWEIGLSEYYLRVNVVTPEHNTHSQVSQPWHYRLPCLSRPIDKFGLSLYGDFRSALELPDYPVQFKLEGPYPHESDHGSCYRLTLSLPDPVITIEYHPRIIPHGEFEKLSLRADIQIASTLSDVGGSQHQETHTLLWEDTTESGWPWRFEPDQTVGFTSATGEKLSMSLSCELVWHSEYCPIVEFKRS